MNIFFLFQSINFLYRVMILKKKKKDTHSKLSFIEKNNSLHKKEITQELGGRRIFALKSVFTSCREFSVLSRFQL